MRCDIDGRRVLRFGNHMTARTDLIAADTHLSSVKQNADILLLPECFITGYDLTISNGEALTETDIQPLCNKAKELGIGLVATALTKGKKSPQNSAFRPCQNSVLASQNK